MKKVTLLSVGVLVFCAGCAVMTVDVDVYKGPLANTEEIQGEQVISLAMGAKPLLVQLRDHLEVTPRIEPRRSSKGGYTAASSARSDLNAALKKLRSSPFYEAAYMAPAKNDHDGHQFENELAIRVNEILGLYEDQADPVVDATLREARTLINQYRAAFDLLEPETNRDWLQKWNGWKVNRRKDADPRLIAAYDKFFSVTRRGTNDTKWRSNTEVMHPGCLKERETNAVALDPNDPWRLARFEGMTNKCDYTARFRFYRDVLADADAERLFGDGKNASKAEFRLAVYDIAESYFQARLALRRLLRLMLITVGELHTSSNSELSKKDDFLRGAAHAAATLINPEKLKLAKGNIEKRFEASSNAFGLSMGISGSHVKFRDKLRGDFFAFPELARVLLEVDEQLVVDGLAPYGLVRGPTDNLDSTQDLLPEGELAKTMEDLAKARGPLDGGRLQAGIEAAIENYLTAAQSAIDTSRRLELPQAQRLLASLIGFGQKVAQLGNSVVLINSSEGSDVRQYVAVLQSVGNSILVHVDELKQQALYHRRLKRTGSIVAETLRMHTGLPNTSLEQWKTNEWDAKDAVIQLETVLRADYVKALLDQPEVQPTTATTKADIVVRGAKSVEATLESSLRTAIATNEAPIVVTNVATSDEEVKLTLGPVVTSNVTAEPGAKIKRAIEAVTEMHEGMIYLRPASAYLRSSYPASSLGKPSSQRSQNMLERMWLRQIPFVGSLVDGVDQRELKTFLEIDQQSWQNVNRIRVSGAGSVNYVVAKDDVGNWYVKQYASNRDDVYRSMRNLAMFSAGDAFGGGLPLRGKSGAVLLQTNPVLQVQLLRTQADLLGKLTNTLLNFGADASNLLQKAEAELEKVGVNDAGVKTEFRNRADGLKDATESILGTWSKVLEDKKASTEQKVEATENRVVELAKSFQGFGGEGTNLGSGDSATKGLEVLRKVSFERIETRLNEVKNAFREFQRSLGVIQTGMGEND
jgi:hypothetical protein